MIAMVVGITACDSGGGSTDVGIEQNYTLRVTIEGEGNVSPPPGRHDNLEPGTVVELQASASSGWLFSHWEGNVQNRNSEITSVVIDKNTTVKAVFIPDEGGLESNIYKDDYFKIEYPLGWDKLEDDPVLYLVPDDESVLYIERFSYENNITNSDFNLFVENLETDWELDPNYDLQYSYSRGVGGQQGWEYILLSSSSALGSLSNSLDINSAFNLSDNMIAKLNADDLKLKVVITYRDNHLFLLIYGAPNNNFNKHVSNIDRVINSFEYQFGQHPDGRVEPPKEVIKYEEVKELEPDITADIASFSDEEDRLVFSKRSDFVDGIVKGEILLANPDDNIPDGLIHRVTGISNDGLTVYTEPVTMEEVIEQGTVELKRSISFEEFVDGLVLAQDVEITNIDMGDHKVEFEKKVREGVKLKGFVRLASEIDLAVTSSYYFRLNTFDFVVDADFEMEVKFETDLGIEFPKYENEYNIFTFWGPRLMFYPGVWITPRFQIRSGLKAEIGGSLSTGVSFRRQVEAGIRYDRSRSPSFTTIRNFSGDGWEFNPLTITGTAEALAYGGFDLSGFAWGSAGMAVGVFGFSEAKGEISYDFDRWAWEYDFSMGAKVASKAELELIRIAKLSYDGPEYEVLRLPLAYAVSGQVFEKVNGEKEGLEDVRIDFEGTNAFGGNIDPAFTDEEGYWTKDLLGGTVMAIPSKEGYVFDPVEKELDKGDSGVNFEAKEDIVLKIVPGSLAGETNERYEFELIAENIPEDITEIRFNWDFGDGIITDGSNLSKGNELITVSNSTATHLIGHEYKEEGSYTLKVWIENLLGERLAEAVAPMAIELDGVEVLITGSRVMYWELADGATEAENTFEAVVRPAGTGQYRFEWDFDDGSSVYVDKGESSIVSHYYTGLKDGDEFRPKVTIYDLDEPGVALAEDSIRIVVSDLEEDNGNGHEDDDNMVFVEAGTIDRGDLFPITVDNNYYISKYPVTQFEYSILMGYNPARFNDNDHPELSGNSGDRPVERVTWFDAVYYANKLSELHGLDQYYNISNIRRVIDHEKQIHSATVTENKGANGFRLPTYSEHQFAARGGLNGAFTKFAGSDNLDDVGWYIENSHAANLGDRYNDEATMPVGLKQPNELGLYDMSGNVWEYLGIFHGEGEFASIRLAGGSFSVREHVCEFPSVTNGTAGARQDSIGFRLVRSP